MKDIKLVALDLDGTLFDNSSRISKRNLTAIRSITDKGIHVVISTGRPFEGIPFDQIKGTGINYAITANGSGIYEISTGKCLYENAMDEELVTPILNFLLTPCLLRSKTILSPHAHGWTISCSLSMKIS